MELRHLRYFVAVAEDLNFTRAAARLHVAHPALSVQVRQLEAEIGAQLLSRQGRGVKLTEAGRLFLDHARATLARASLGATVARQAARGEVGHLAIRYVVAAEFLVLPKIVPAFMKQWPEVQLSFHSLNFAQQFEALRRDEVDLGFVWLPIPAADFEIHELMADPLVVVLWANHPLASRSEISIQELLHEPLILIPRALDQDTYRQIEQLFLKVECLMTVAYELKSSISVINFVAMGIGWSIVPGYVRKIGRDGVVYIPLKPPNAVRPLAIIKKKGSGGLAESFFQFTVEHFSRGD